MKEFAKEASGVKKTPALHKDAGAGGASLSIPDGENDRRLAKVITEMAMLNHAALGELYDQTADRVYGLALRITRKPESAEEVVADVFLHAWKYAACFDSSRGNAIAWLLTICRSRSLDLLRAADHAQSHPDPEVFLVEKQCHVGDPLDLLLAIEKNSIVHRALRELSASTRELIALAFFRGLTHAEIADETKLPLGTVKSRLRGGLNSLREALSREV